MITSTNAPKPASDNAPGLCDEKTGSTARTARRRGSAVFADPVAYLASFGIDAELIEIHTLPVAA